MDATVVQKRLSELHYRPLATSAGRNLLDGYRERLSFTDLFYAPDDTINCLSAVERACAAFEADGKQFSAVVELGAGSGILSLHALSHAAGASAQGILIDIDTCAEVGAKSVAEANARALGLGHRCRFVATDVLEPDFAAIGEVASGGLLISNLPHLPIPDEAPILDTRHPSIKGAGPRGDRYWRPALRMADQLRADRAVIGLTSLADVGKLFHDLSETEFSIESVTSCTLPAGQFTRQCMPYFLERDWAQYCVLDRVSQSELISFLFDGEEPPDPAVLFVLLTVVLKRSPAVGGQIEGELCSALRSLAQGDPFPPSLARLGQGSATFLTQEAEHKLSVEFRSMKAGSRGAAPRRPDVGMVASSVSVIPTMIHLPGGKFTMGDLWGDGEPDEGPLFDVTLKPYSLSRCLVMNREFSAYLQELGICDREVVRRDGRGPDTDWERYPRVHVSLAGAQAYCRWLSAKTGKVFRLPRETEWQYAALGPGRLKWSLSNSFSRQAYHCNADSPTYADIGQETDLGFLHLTGNVFEWCGDEYRPSFLSPQGALKGTRVIKGGAFILRESKGLRNSARFSCADESSLNCVGFRVVCED